MKEILFRGKDLSGIMNHGWFYGSLDLSFNPEFPRIICKDRFDNTIYIEVDKETVGQFTGIKDKNGTKIFEGDILLYDNVQKVVVSFKNGQFVIDHYAINLLCERNNKSEVIGNIYDNPELTHQHEDKGENFGN